MVLLPSFSKTCFWCAVCRCRNSCDKFLWTMRSILYHVTCVTRDWKPSECTCEKLIRFCSTAGILWQGSPPGIDQEDKDFDRESKLRRLAVWGFSYLFRPVRFVPACRTTTKFKLGHGEVDSQVGHYNMTSFGLSWSWVAVHENEGCLARGWSAGKETRTNLKCWRVSRFGHSVCHLRRVKNTICQGGLTSMSDFLQLDEKTLYNAKAVGLGQTIRKVFQRFSKSHFRWSSWPHEGFACLHCWNSGPSCSLAAWFVFGLFLVSNEFGNTVSTSKSHVRLRNTVRHQTLSP